MKTITYLPFSFVTTLVVFMLLSAGCSIQAPPATDTEMSSANDAQPVSEAVQIEGALDLARDIDVQTAASVLDRDDIFLLDVREPWEHQTAHIAGNTLIPTGSVADRLAEIPTDKEVIVYCHSGARSARITAYLEGQGYTNIHNMLGGIVAWQKAGFEVE